MQADSDCVVVGAGLVGSIAALALADLGLKVTVLERRPQLSSRTGDDVRALVLSAASVRILESYGVWSRVQADAWPVREIFVSDRGGFPAVKLTAEEIGVDALGWSCPADRLLHAFNAALIERPDIVMRWSTSFHGTQQQATSTSAMLAVSGARNKQVEHYSTRLLVAADGADSAVREARGIAIERLDYAQTAIVANVTASRPHSTSAYEHFTRRGPLALIPRGGARYVSVQCLDNESATSAYALDDGQYLAMLERRFGRRLGHFSELGPRRRHALVRQRAATLSAVRTLVIGNAANTLHPNAAQGLNLGLRDVAALSSALRGVDDPGAPTALAHYQGSRRRDHSVTGAFTDVLAQAFRSRLGVVACARRSALMLTAYVGPVRRRMILDASGLGALARDARPA